MHLHGRSGIVLELFLRYDSDRVLPTTEKNPAVWRNAKGKKGRGYLRNRGKIRVEINGEKRNLIIAYRRSPTELLRLNFYSWSATSFAFTRVAVVSNPSWLASKMSPLLATRFMLLVLSSEYVLASSELPADCPSSSSSRYHMQIQKTLTIRMA